MSAPNEVWTWGLSQTPPREQSAQYEDEQLRWNPAAHLSRRHAEACRDVTLAIDQMPRSDHPTQRRRMWCLSCGAVSDDGECDCTRSEETYGLRRAVDEADEIARQSRQIIDRLETALRAIIERADDGLAPGKAKVQDMRRLAEEALGD